MDSVVALGRRTPRELLGARVVVGAELSDGLFAGLAEALIEAGVPVVRWTSDGVPGDGPLAHVGPSVPAGLRGDPRLVWYHSTNAGVDAVLAAGPWPEDVLMTRTVGRMGERIAQFVLGWVLAECQQVPAHLAQHADRRWQRLPAELVSGQRAVVFGAGGIGSAIGALLRCCGVRTAGVVRDPEGRRAAGFDRLLTLDQATADGVLAEARWVVGALPLTPGTRGYFDRELFAQLRAATFLNVGRGAAVDLPALAGALDAGTVRSAVLDVLPEEPPAADALGWRLPRTVVTSHSSGVTEDSDVLEDFAAVRHALASGTVPADLTVRPRRGY